MRFSEMPIRSNPRKMGGKVCIANTRMPVEDFLIHLAQGGSIDTFCKMYEWDDIGQLKAVIQFAIMDMGQDKRAVERARAVTNTVDVARGAVQEPALP